MKYTLLELTQAILSSMDSDEINSITDSVEAQQVVTVIRTAYFDILGRANLPEHYSLVNLDASGDATKPVLMTLPSTIESIAWVKYNKETTDDTDLQMRLVTYQPLEEFLDRMHELSETATNVDTFTQTIGSETFVVLYYTDKAPDYYTTFDDNTLLFDSYDSAVDATLQGSKSLCYAKGVIPFTSADSFIPDLDEPQFALLLSEAKSLAWAELRQTQHAKAEQSARRGWVSLQRSKYAAKEPSFFNSRPNYGRK